MCRAGLYVLQNTGNTYNMIKALLKGQDKKARKGNFPACETAAEVDGVSTWDSAWSTMQLVTLKEMLRYLI